MMPPSESSQTLMKARAMSRSHTVPRNIPRPLFNRLATAIRRRLHLRQSRQRLAALDPHMLADIGLTPEQARHEAIRPVWDAPPGWLNRD